MLFDVLVFLLVALITMYLATQGMVSSLIALATATFSSILAIGLTEPLQGIVGSFRPDYGRGVTFLLLFFLIFSATRIVSDTVVKKNIKLNLWVNRAVGGFFGFFTALVVVGSIIIGIEMLPVRATLLGFERFPNPRLMSPTDSDGKVIYGEATRSRATVLGFLSPDGFVLTLWNAASGRSLGGNSWSAAHPDFTMETYGYRYPVYPGSMRTAPKDLVKVQSLWSATEPKDYQSHGIPVQTGKRVVVVRVEVQKGDKPPTITYDADGFLRVAAAQVRLVAGDQKGEHFHQYYPIGDLYQGRTFEPLALDAGFIVDDYNSKNTAVEDWVFAIGEDESPTLFEFKTARTEGQDLAAVTKDKPVPPLRVADYPARGYFKDLCTYTVTFDPGATGKIVAGHVYVLKPEAKMKDIHRVLKDSYDNVLASMKNIENSSNGWSNPPKPGLPDYGSFRNAQNIGVNRVNDPDDQSVNWQDILPILLLGQVTPDPRTNLTAIPTYMHDQIVEKMWSNISSGTIISGMAEAEKDVATVRRISPALHPCVITLQTDTGFWVWMDAPAFVPPPDAKTPQRDATFLAEAKANSKGLIFHFDLP